MSSTCIYLSIKVQLLQERLEHVNESLAVFLVALQVLRDEQHQLKEEWERDQDYQYTRL